MRTNHQLLEVRAGQVPCYKCGCTKRSVFYMECGLMKGVYCNSCGIWFKFEGIKKNEQEKYLKNFQKNKKNS